MIDDQDTDKDIPPLIVKLILRLASRESFELEYKSAQGGLPNKALWETMSAFANTEGGWIVLGIVVQGGTLILEGVRNAHDKVKQLFDLMRNSQKISYPICGNDDISVESLEGKDVIIIRVPAAPRKMRPVYINQNPYTGAYLRRHEGDYHATKPEVDRMMREASDVGADSAILKRYSLDDIDRDTLGRYRRRHQTLHPDSPWVNHDDLQFLKALNGYRRDRETGDEGLTVAGLLMFGTVEAIREWRTRHLIDYRAVPANGTIDGGWNDRIEWEGNLLGAYETLAPKLVSNQPVPFTLNGEVRSAEGPVHVALREALVNMLVHADYAETQPSLIIHAPDRYYFRNPGSSRVPESDLFTGNRSDPRNPELVRMFRMIGLTEEAGTGIPRIFATWRSLGLQWPQIDVGTERYEFALELRHAHLLSDDDLTWLATFGPNWSEAEQLALVCARYEDGIDNLRLRQITGLHPADATKVLSALRSRGLLVMVRGGRGAYYRLHPTLLGEMADQFETNHRANAQQAQRSIWDSAIESTAEYAIEANTGDNAWSTGDKEVNTGDNAWSTGDKEVNTGDNALDEQQFETELVELSKRAQEKPRLNPDERDELIVLMCSIRALSIQELSTLLDRSIDHVRKVLQPLIASGRLTYLYPTQPQHPRQRYLTPQQGG